jgi:hypothetical protein
LTKNLLSDKLNFFKNINLEELDLSSNKLNETIDFSKNINLKQLDIRENLNLKSVILNVKFKKTKLENFEYDKDLEIKYSKPLISGDE